MTLRRILYLVLFLAFQTAILHGQQADKANDGYWWNSLDESFRLGFVEGYVMAMNRASDFVTFTCVAEKNGGQLPAHVPDEDTLRPCANTPAAKPFAKYGGFHVGQWRDGVNEFYKDFRNRTLDVQLAIQYVGQQLHGTPAKELEDEVTDWRRTTAK